MNEIENKEIEEMAKVIEGTFTYAKKWYPDKYEPFELNVYPDDIAGELYNAGYRNVKDKTVSRREWYQIGYKDATREMQEELRQASELKAETIKLAKQETARKIYEQLCGHDTTYVKKWIKEQYGLEEMNNE